MKTELVQTLTTTFEAHAQQTEGGIEYWLARDLQHLLGYDEWHNFNTAISKAKTACEVSGHRVADHFVGVNKMVDLGSGTTREVEDLMLTRYLGGKESTQKIGWAVQLRRGMSDIELETLNVQARELEETIAENVAEVLGA